MRRWYNIIDIDVIVPDGLFLINVNIRVVDIVVEPRHLRVMCFGVPVRIEVELLEGCMVLVSK